LTPDPSTVTTAMLNLNPTIFDSKNHQNAGPQKTRVNSNSYNDIAAEQGHQE